jgi:uncharacterized LabA/DUF88 family protein
MPQSEQDVILFIDYQNTYQCARQTFFSKSDHYTKGQYDPIAMGQLICSKALPKFKRNLKEVRIYTGQPDGRKDPIGYGASQKQFAHWRKKGITVLSRPLRYSPAYPDEKPEEKGIDVKLAVDFIDLALDGAVDVGVIASTDTDLIPAIDFVIDRCWKKSRVEVAAWTGQRRNPRLSSKKRQLWCHWLNKSDYGLIADPTNYTK